MLFCIPLDKWLFQRAELDAIAAIDTDVRRCRYVFVSDNVYKVPQRSGGVRGEYSDIRVLYWLMLCEYIQ